MVKENGDHVQDGADEKMLGDEREVLATKGVEVKFIPADQNQNGDAKIDIRTVEKVSCQTFAYLISGISSTTCELRGTINH